MDMDPVSRAERVLESQELLWGPNSIEVANTLVKLSQLYIARGHHPEAEVCLARALDLKFQLYGPDSPEVLSLVEAVAARSREQVRSAEAAKLGRCYEREHRNTGNAECGGKPAAGALEESFGKHPEFTQKPPQEPTGLVSLLVTEATGERFELRHGLVFIGRDECNDIALRDDSTAEKSQVMIKKEGDEYWLTNQAKSSPTMLNFQPVVKKTKLCRGDVLTVGTTTILID